MTLLVSDIIRSGYKNTDYFNTNFMDLIRNQRSRIFGFDYPIDQKFKEDFEVNFILHFFNYRISDTAEAHTYLSWQTMLADRMYQLFPLYNQFFEKITKEDISGTEKYVSRETFDEDTVNDSMSNSVYNDNTDVAEESVQNTDNVNRDFPLSSVTNTNAYMTDSQDNTETKIFEHNADSRGDNITTGNDVGSRNFNRNKTDEKMMIDFDYYKRFREELNGIYSEIYKFCCDLFICAW